MRLQLSQPHHTPILRAGLITSALGSLNKTLEARSCTETECPSGYKIIYDCNDGSTNLGYCRSMAVSYYASIGMVLPSNLIVCATTDANPGPAGLGHFVCAPDSFTSVLKSEGKKSAR